MCRKNCWLYCLVIICIIWNLVEAVCGVVLGSIWQEAWYIVFGVATGIVGLLLALGVFMNKPRLVLGHIIVRTTWLLLTIIFLVIWVIQRKLPIDNFKASSAVLVVSLLLQCGVYLFYRQMVSDRNEFKC